MIRNVSPGHVLTQSRVAARGIARRYALEEFSLTRASSRLPIVALALGEETMRTILSAMLDPTDSLAKQHRHVVYMVEAFQP